MDDVAAIYKELGQIDGAVKAAHRRVDDVETAVRGDLTEIKVKLDNVITWMHRTQGKTQAVMFLAGALGAAAMEIIKVLTHK